MYLPGFSNLMRRSRAQTQATNVMTQASSIDGLAALVARFIPAGIFKSGAAQRNRLFTAKVTFTAFLAQVMDRGSSCREAVRRVQAWFVASGQPAPDGNTSAYCQARSRLSLDLIRSAFEQLCSWFDAETRCSDLWMGRTVKVLDGTGLSMPDTERSRRKFGYAGGQLPGCGFPTAKLVALFSLATGHLSRFILSDWKPHDVHLARSLLGWINPGEIILADRGFCGWPFIACLVRKQVDIVVRLNSSKRCNKSYENWGKPQRRRNWGKSLWRELPQSIAIRFVHHRISEPGFRVQNLVIMTTLIDAQKYPDHAIIELYARRWQIELNFRDIKTTLGLDILRSKTPDMIAKEVYMQAIAYNIVRAVMLTSARQHAKGLYQISFKGTVDTLSQWTVLFAHSSQKVINARWENLICALAADLVPVRPNRSEPRAIKRRPKPHQRLNRPRHKMVVRDLRRATRHLNAAKRALS